MFDGQALTITRNGALGMMTQGRNEKVIPLSAIGAVQFRPPTLATNGVWSVSVVGEAQSSKNARGMRAVAKVARDDENSIIVRHGQSGAFKALGEAINAARMAPPSAPAPAPAPAPDAPSGGRWCGGGGGSAPGGGRDASPGGSSMMRRSSGRPISCYLSCPGPDVKYLALTATVQ